MIPETYGLLPSFFGEHLCDKNGARYPDPIFELHEMAANDTLQRMKDIRNIFDIDRCPNILKELYKAFDFDENVEQEEEGVYRYPLADQSIVHIDKLYTDVNFENKFGGDFRIGHNTLKRTRFIEFDEATRRRLYAKSVYVDIYPAVEFYGKLLGYTPIINLYAPESTENINYIDFDYVKEQLDAARGEILSLLYVRMTGTTAETLTNYISAVLGASVSFVDGTITGIEGNTIIVDTGGKAVPNLDGGEDSIGVATLKVNGDVNPKLRPGHRIKRFEPLSKPPVYVYDFYSEPARFTQTLLADSAKTLEKLLEIKTKDKEQYAALFWDSGLKWDAMWPLFYDMGDHSLVENIESNVSYYDLPIDDGTLVGNFTGGNEFADPRFEGTHPRHSIAEMFSNVTIIEVNEGDKEKTMARLNRFLPMVKQSFTKFVVVFKTAL